MNKNEQKRMNRRELLKLTPVLAFGALTLPPFREELLKTGLSWTDRAAGVFWQRKGLLGRPGLFLVRRNLRKRSYGND